MRIRNALLATAFAAILGLGGNVHAQDQDQGQPAEAADTAQPQAQQPSAVTPPPGGPSPRARPVPRTSTCPRT